MYLDIQLAMRIQPDLRRLPPSLVPKYNSQVRHLRPDQAVPEVYMDPLRAEQPRRAVCSGELAYLPMIAADQCCVNSWFYRFYG